MPTGCDRFMRDVLRCGLCPALVRCDADARSRSPAHTVDCWWTWLLGCAALLFRRLQARIRELRDSHFTYQGTMSQIRSFLQGGPAKSDLRCRALPEYVR